MKHRASAISCFVHRCQRLAYYLYVLEIEVEEEPEEDGKESAAEFGTRLHANYEGYFLGQVAEKQLPALNRRGLATGVYPLPTARGLRVEHQFNFRYFSLDYTGTIDLGLGPCVWDHKSSGNPEEWALGGRSAVKRPIDDIQGAQYLMATALDYPGRDWYEARWVIHHRFNEKWTPRVFRSVVTADEIRAAFERLVHTPAREFHRLIQIGDVEQVPACLQSCHAFGKRCPAWDHCSTDVGDRIDAQMETET